MRMRTRCRWAGLGLAGATILIGVGLQAALASGVTTPASQLTSFRDASGRLALAIQLAPGRPDTGAFDFTVSGAGDYRGVVPLRPSGPDADQPGGEVHPEGVVAARFFPEAGGPPQSVNVRVQGEIDLARHRAEVEVKADQTEYHLKTAEADARAASPVVQQSVSAIVASDWATLYSLTSSDARGGLSQSQFVQFLATQNGPTITSATPNGQGTLVTPSTGYTYFAQPLALQARQPDGSSKNYTATLYLILEQGTWRVFSTTTPAAA